MHFAQSQWAKKNLSLLYVKEQLRQIGMNNAICKDIKENDRCNL